jgi:hypothetical protein
MYVDQNKVSGSIVITALVHGKPVSATDHHNKHYYSIGHHGYLISIHYNIVLCCVVRSISDGLGTQQSSSFNCLLILL